VRASGGVARRRAGFPIQTRAEVIWTRLFGLLLSHTTYTFSIILAMFSIGIGMATLRAYWQIAVTTIGVRYVVAAPSPN